MSQMARPQEKLDNDENVIALVVPLVFSTFTSPPFLRAVFKTEPDISVMYSLE